MKVNIKFKKLYKDTQLPKQAFPGDAGMDLYAYIDKDFYFHPNHIHLVDCGFAMSMPLGWEAQIRPRSGLASKKGVTVINTPGTVDYSYRGPIKVALINLGPATVIIHNGDRIAQMVISEVPEVTIDEVEELDDTERSTSGFGSTGD